MKRGMKEELVDEEVWIQEIPVSCVMLKSTYERKDIWRPSHQRRSDSPLTASTAGTP
jgi:hypothetical protein